MQLRVNAFAMKITCSIAGTGGYGNPPPVVPSCALLRLLARGWPIRPRHFPLNLSQSRPHSRGMRRSAGVGVETGQVGKVALDVVHAHINVLASIHAGALFATYRCTPA